MFDFDGLPTYWKDLLLVLSLHKARKLGDEHSRREAMERINEPAYKRLLGSSFLPAIH